MAAVVGGLRARLIHDSAYEMIKGAIVELGWSGPNRRHLPVGFRPKAVPFDEEVQVNLLAVSQTDVSHEDAEMGSNLSEDRWTFYVDLYAENESIGTHLIHDVRDILRGKMASIGRSRPNLAVMDYGQATPVTLFYCDIENVIVDRANDFPKPWQRYWYVCRFEVLDVYGDEDEIYPPAPSEANAWFGGF